MHHSTFSTFFKDWLFCQLRLKLQQRLEKDCISGSNAMTLFAGEFR